MEDARGTEVTSGGVTNNGVIVGTDKQDDVTTGVDGTDGVARVRDKPRYQRKRQSVLKRLFRIAYGVYSGLKGI